jgi:hypothetical protein
MGNLGFEYHGYGAVTMRLCCILAGCLLLLELVNSLVVKPCQLTSGVFWRVMTLGKWESRLEVKVYTSVELKLIYQPCSQTQAVQTLT